MPAPLAQELETAVKEGNYSSKSEFIRQLLREWRKQQVLAEVQESRREIAAGKGKVLKNFKDLR